MADLRRLPPGRAGRIWLTRRRVTAERGVDLLDRKLRILRGEQQRFRLIEERARADWERGATEARMWFVRAVALVGERELRFATPQTAASVAVTWSGVMGVRYPSAVACDFPEPDPSGRVSASSAMDRAMALHRESVRLAAAHAAAAAACSIIDAEVAEVKRRLTALTERWLPRLEAARQELDARLEENERSEIARLRTFVRQSGKDDQR